MVRERGYTCVECGRRSSQPNRLCLDCWRSRPPNPTPVRERIWKLVGEPTPDGCWPWLGCQDGNGYGLVFVDQRIRARRAHRVIYELLVGPVPDGLTLDHLCRVRHCVNPAHLEPVTSRENTLRGFSFAALNSRKTHCKRGHALIPENLERTTVGRRSCRICMAARSRAYRKRLAERQVAA